MSEIDLYLMIAVVPLYSGHWRNDRRMAGQL